MAPDDHPGGRRLTRDEVMEAARQRCAERPFPGGPLTAGLTSGEAAELSGRLARAWETMWAMRPGVEEWMTPEADAHAGAMWELEDTVHDVEAETIVSGLRGPLETLDGFRQRAGRGPGRAADAGGFSGLPEPQPTADFEMEI